jgi:hypothetical protein
VDCRKDQRIIHSSDCPFAKQYGGKSRAEALKNCFKEREPTLRLPDKPLDLSFASGLLIAVAVLAGLVLLGAVRDHWPEARSGLLWFPRFLFFLVRFFIRAPFSICAGILVGLVNLVGMVIGFIIGILIAALQLVFSVANIPIYLCSIILREIGYFTLAA